MKSFPSREFQTKSQLDTCSLPGVVKCCSEQTYDYEAHITDDFIFSQDNAKQYLRYIK